MKIRGVLSVLLGNIIAPFLLAVAGFLTVRFAPWGRWAVDSARESSSELASKYGDPVSLLEKGMLFHLLLTGPIIAFVVRAIVWLVYRLANSWVSMLSVVSLVIVLSLPTSLLKGFAACLYVLASWLAMKLVTSRLVHSATNSTALSSMHR
jgi:uncharacterized membrane protein